jgi:L-iditol 2-dehydrogenase
MMKGLVKYEKGPGNMEVRTLEDPIAKPGYVKIEVKAAGICGSDIHILHSDIAIPVNPPVVTGHEFSGVVTEIGEGVTTCKVGDRVTSETAYAYCGKCHNCKVGRYNLCDNRLTLGYGFNGELAKYTVGPEDRIHNLADSISFETAALLEPMACVAHALIDLSTIVAGDTVMISGPGAIGLIALQIAKAHGAVVVVSGTGVDTDRLEFAKQLGADYTIDVVAENLQEFVGKITKGKGVDIVYECSGSDRATASGLEAVKKGGQFVQVGLHGKPITLNFERICYKEIKVAGTLGSVWTSWDKAIQLVEQGKVLLEPLVSHKFPLEEWERAFEVFEKKEGLKVIIQP